MAIRSLTNIKTAVLSLFSADEPRQPTQSELTEDLAPPAEPVASGPVTGAVRRAVDTGYKLDYTLADVSRALRSIQDGKDVREFVRMSMTLLRRNAKLRSVMTTRVLAVTGLHRVVDPAGTSRRDKKAAEACLALAKTPHFKRLVRHLMWGSYVGWQGAQAMYGEGSEFWPIKDFKLLPPEWFTFDQTDGVTPLLLPAELGGEPAQLEPFGKFVFHTPQLLTGPAFTGGLAYTAVFYAALGLIVLDSGSQYVELFGQPLRLGKYPPGEGGPEAEKARKTLRKALENLGSDAWAMIPETMKIEFIRDATTAGGADVYEKWSRYLDELLAQLVLGASLSSGTGNTGSGGSQALGVVHNELRADLMRADADDLADTLVRDVFTPFVRFNFGEDVAVPHFRFHIEEAEDVSALADAVAKLVPLGLRVSQDELRERFGLRAPDTEEEILGTTAPAEPAPGAPTTQQQTARFAADCNPAADQPDELDVLTAEYLTEAGYTRADAALNADLLTAIGNARTADELVETLAAFAAEADVDSVRDHLTGLVLSARAAGETGADLGGK